MFTLRKFDERTQPTIFSAVRTGQIKKKRESFAEKFYGEILKEMF